MTIKLVENSTSKSGIYFETEEENEILIGGTETTIGEVVSIVDKVVTKTGGLSLTVDNLPNGTAVLLDSATEEEKEIRRVDTVLDSNSFVITRDVLYTHTGQDCFKDFNRNANSAYNSSKRAGIIEFDNFGNSMQLSEISTGIIIFNKCTEFTGLNSLFLYDNLDNMIDRQESFIVGTYDIFKNDEQNVYTPFLTKQNRSVNYIVNMVEFNGDLDEDGKVTIPSLQSNIYSVSLNGDFIEPSKYSIIGGVLTVTDDTILQAYSNYVRVLHYPDQRTLSGYTVRIKVQFYEKDFISDKPYLDLLNHFTWIDNFSSQANPEYYDYRNRETKQNEKLKINQNNKLTFNAKMGQDDEDLKNIVINIKNYLKGKDFFRLIRYVEEPFHVEYYYGCRITDGINFNENIDANNYTYSIDYLKKVSISPHTWGDENFKWGTFEWGLLATKED